MTCRQYSNKKWKYEVIPAAAATEVLTPRGVGVSAGAVMAKFRGRFKNTYEFLNPRALKTSTLYKNRIFQCNIFCVELQKVHFQIPHKISHPYIQRRVFYSEMNIQEIVDLRAQKCFQNGLHVCYSSHFLSLTKHLYPVQTHMYDMLSLI